MNIQGWFPLGLTDSLRQRDSPRLLPRPRLEGKEEESWGAEEGPHMADWQAGSGEPQQGAGLPPRSVFCFSACALRGTSLKKTDCQAVPGLELEITAGHSPNSHRVVPAPTDLSHHPTSPQHTDTPTPTYRMRICISQDSPGDSCAYYRLKGYFGSQGSSFPELIKLGKTPPLGVDSPGPSSRYSLHTLLSPPAQHLPPCV